MPGDPKLFDFTEFALLVEHELLHNKGLKHGEYGNTRAHYPGSHRGEEAPRWALRLVERGVPFRAPVKKAVDPEARIKARAQKVDERVAFWQRKLALAKTKLKKYQTKQRYYERRAAAPPASNDTMQQPMAAEEA